MLNLDHELFEKETVSLMQFDSGMSLPIFLAPDVDATLSRWATAKGVEIEELVNEILRANIRLIKTTQMS